MRVCVLALLASTALAESQADCHSYVAECKARTQCDQMQDGGTATDTCKWFTCKDNLGACGCTCAGMDRNRPVQTGTCEVEKTTASGSDLCLAQEPSDWQRDAILKAHNEIRAKHGACDLRWSRDLARDARDSEAMVGTCDGTWPRKLPNGDTQKHNSNVGGTVTYNSTNYLLGENIAKTAMSSFSLNPDWLTIFNWDPAVEGTKNVKDWYCDEAECWDFVTTNEEKKYSSWTPTTEDGPTTGHMTNIIDSSAVAIGCGMCHTKWVTANGQPYAQMVLLCQYLSKTPSSDPLPTAPPGETFVPTPVPTPSPGGAASPYADRIQPYGSEVCNGHGTCVAEATCDCEKEVVDTDLTAYYGGARCALHGIAHGDPHFMNIYGRRFDLHGDPGTPYVLYADSEVKVTGWFGPCSDPVSYVTCVKRVSVWRLKGMLIEFKTEDVGTPNTELGRRYPVTTANCGPFPEDVLAALGEGVGVEKYFGFPGVRLLSPNSRVWPSNSMVKLGLYDEVTGAAKVHVGVTYHAAENEAFRNLEVSIVAHNLPAGVTGLLVDPGFVRGDRSTWPVDDLVCAPEAFVNELPCATCGFGPQGRGGQTLGGGPPEPTTDVPTPAEALAMCAGDAARARAEACCTKGRRGCEGFLGQCLFDECVLASPSEPCLQHLDDALRFQDQAEPLSCYCEDPHFAVDVVTGVCGTCKAGWYPEPARAAGQGAAACAKYCDAKTTCQDRGVCDADGMCLCDGNAVPAETCGEVAACVGGAGPAAVVELDGVPVAAVGDAEAAGVHDLPQFVDSETQVVVPVTLPLPAGSELRLSCCGGGGDVCSFVVSVYHCAPCSRGADGGIPRMLASGSAGSDFEAGSCAPRVGVHRDGMVSFLTEVRGGEAVTLPVTTDPAKHLVVFAKVGTFAAPWCPAKGAHVGCGARGSPGPCPPRPACVCHDN